MPNNLTPPVPLTTPSGRHGRYCTWLAAERSEDRDERRALYDVLQASWSDAVYFSERERLEAREAVEIGEADVPFVDYDDRHDGLE